MCSLLLGYAAFSFNRAQAKQSLPAPPTDTVPALKEVVSPSAFFYSKSVGLPNNTFVSIPFDFPEKPQPLWLYLAMKAGTPKLTRLMYDPQLASLDWPVVSNSQVSLYQKKDTYQSIEEFLKQPPSQPVIMDGYLTQVSPYQAIKGDKLSPGTSFNADQYDFILTTYKPPRREQNVYYFETTIDATESLITDNQELAWQIYAPDASPENPYLLGQIHVNYR